MSEDQPIFGPAANGHITIQDVTALVTYVSGQIVQTEVRISNKIDQNALAAEARWAKFEAKLDGIDSRVERLEDQDRDDRTRREARVEPVKKSATFILRYWREMALLGVSLSAIVGAIVGKAA